MSVWINSFNCFESFLKREWSSLAQERALRFVWGLDGVAHGLELHVAETLACLPVMIMQEVHFFTWASIAHVLFTEDLRNVGSHCPLCPSVHAHVGRRERRLLFQDLFENPEFKHCGIFSYPSAASCCRWKEMQGSSLSALEIN